MPITGLHSAQRQWSSPVLSQVVSARSGSEALQLSSYLNVVPVVMTPGAAMTSSYRNTYLPHHWPRPNNTELDSCFAEHQEFQGVVLLVRDSVTVLQSRMFSDAYVFSSLVSEMHCTRTVRYPCFSQLLCSHQIRCLTERPGATLPAGCPMPE